MIIGERINSTRTNINDAIKRRDAAAILKEAELQVGAGANFIDINCAVTSGDELQDMEWVINVIQASAIKDAGISIDSPNHLAIAKALEVHKGNGSMIINSITGEESRIKNILPLALKYKAKLIALAMDEAGMPNTAKERFEMVKKILDRVRRDGYKDEDIYFDPLIRPISTEPTQANEFLESLPLIKSLGVKTICGLSNISFGLPNRPLVNSVFLSMAIRGGLDAAILDPLDKRVMSSVYASKALIATDSYCTDYIKAFREGQLI